jgi:endogenous inhibitor of DNA gyrase (YacG/DUF329 family)
MSAAFNKAKQDKRPSSKQCKMCYASLASQGKFGEFCSKKCKELHGFMR